MYKQVKNVVATVQVHNKVENSLSLLLFSAPLLTLLSPPSLFLLLLVKTVSL